MNELLWKFTDDSVKLSSTIEGFTDYGVVGPVSFGASRFVSMEPNQQSRNTKENASFLELQGSLTGSPDSLKLFAAFCAGKALGELTIVKLMHVEKGFKVEEKLVLSDVKFTSYNRMMSGQGSQDTFTIAYTKLTTEFHTIDSKNKVTPHSAVGFDLAKGVAI